MRCICRRIPTCCSENGRRRSNSNVAGEQAEKVRGIPEDRIHDLDYLVLAYLQLAQDAKAKQAVDLAREIEDDMVARKA